MTKPNASQSLPDLRKLLARGIHSRVREIEAPLLDKLERALRPAFTNSADPLAAACARLSAWIAGRLDRIVELHRLGEDYGARIARASDPTGRRSQILEFARALGADARQIKGDARAFKRWFGLDAVAERHRRRVAMAEREATFGLGRLAVLTAERLARSSAEEMPRVWRRCGVEDATTRAMIYAGDARVRSAGIACLAGALGAAPAPALEELISEATQRRIHRVAFQRGPEVASQGEALSLLRGLSPSAFRNALAQRFADPPPGDDFWLRRRAVTLLCAALPEMPELVNLIPTIRADPSSAVRQALAMHLRLAAPDVVAAHLPALACEDRAPEVRAAALVALPDLAPLTDPALLTTIMARVLNTEKDVFVLRVALDTAARGLDWLPEAARAAWVATLVPAIERLHHEAPSLSVRRWAAHARERMWVEVDPHARVLMSDLRRLVGGLNEGRAARLRRLRGVVRTEPGLVGRVLAVIAQADFGFDLTRGSLGLAPKLQRGERFGFRLWRTWYEFRHVSPDKRQAFLHTIGRIYGGALQAPSAIMAELAQTKVPGEPLFMAEEGGWRPYLPLPDLALSAIDMGCPVHLYTSEGVTEVIPPKGLLRRLLSRLKLSFRFSDIASLRNWTESRSQGPASYLKSLEELGFSFSFRPHPGLIGEASTDPMVSRFFPAALAPLLPPEFWRRIEGYFFSVHQNTLKHLAIFLGLVLAWFLGRHVWLSRRMRRTRAALPLVLGGWGTRGKSGTERIKAAVINALGYSLVSKTTGNEAMFLYGYPFGPVREMFLFRPYDKATIWEQEAIAGLAVKLKGDVFLWECMGLTPAYVKVLQRHWMRDDISTITNTYPDHEDLQGPAGRNIPEVMTNFIPRRGRLFTTEEQMRPILAEAARSLGTPMTGIGWLEAGLLPSDALRRFPYEEHPLNIALVLAMFEEIGVERDYALKEMADRVVPDLGVLKAYPVAQITTRRIEFVMGMSANERFGALGNWTRMGFDKHDPYTEPDTFITAVVNNRADRVPRSRVFAELLVSAVSLDCMVLIGSNLKGFQGYLDEAWDTYATSLTLWPSAERETNLTPAQILESGARHMRIAFRDSHVAAALRAMLEGQPQTLNIEGLVALRDDPEALAGALTQAGVKEADGILVHLASARQTASEYADLERLLAAGDKQAVDAAVRERFRDWFKRKIVVVEDFYASGDQVIDTVRAATPPGFFNRVLGMQNIKGTGLDFVYRWQAWESVYSACEMAEAEDPLISAEGLQTLLTFQEFGILAEERVRATVSLLRDRPEAAGEGFQAQLDLIIDAMEAQLAEVRQGMKVTRSAGFLSHGINALEAVLDAGDAVRRRKKADRVYRDMISERISHERAARELKKLNSRQKGGWLSEDIANGVAELRESLSFK